MMGSWYLVMFCAVPSSQLANHSIEVVFGYSSSNGHDISIIINRASLDRAREKRIRLGFCAAYKDGQNLNHFLTMNYQ